jgi:hypothetical protein
MKNPMLQRGDRMRERVLKELVGGLWHTTHPDRFTKILESGGISPGADIPENERFAGRADAKKMNNSRQPDVERILVGQNAEKLTR